VQTEVGVDKVVDEQVELSEVVQGLVHLAMPQRPLHTVHLLLHDRSQCLIQTEQPFDVLPKYSHAPREMKPIEQMLRLGMELPREVAHRLAPIGQEGERLLVSHAWRLQYLTQPVFRFDIVGLDKAKALGGLVRRHRFADNDLKVALFLLPVPDIAAVEPHGEGPFGEGSRGGRPWPFVSRAAVRHSVLVLSELVLTALGHGQGMILNGGPIQGLVQGKKVLQDPGGPNRA
jgi:hypothetical protein